jgi:hypothetical protein
LEVASGKVIGSCIPKHRHEELLAFLKIIENRSRQAWKFI